MQDYKKAIEKVVNFWVEKSFKTPMNQDNGDNGHSGAMTAILMNMVSMKSQVGISDESIQKFKSKLTELLLSKEDECKRYGLTLSVDYSPCLILYKSANHAGIDVNCFPCKTTSWIESDFTAKVSYQYRGELRTL